ncbi:hypothetical protein F4777DRAFT_459054 [Nemania sp. FL0916]|nr:hypothetical protein F4777DRAFT_459054 [Nemania sp. FL0916]
MSSEVESETRSPTASPSPSPSPSPSSESSSSTDSEDDNQTPRDVFSNRHYDYDDYDEYGDDDSEFYSSSTPSTPSESSSTAAAIAGPQFPHFSKLPPELRHQVWRFAVSDPGINFFNVHAFPNDHPGCCRSTSPPWLYLDLRRLSIEDHDEAVARYDPSTWQARLAVRQTCSEARAVCTQLAEKMKAEDKLATLTLTRPRRGLYVRAGDGKLRSETAMRASNDDDSDSNSDAEEEEEEREREEGEGEGESVEPAQTIEVEPVVRRTVQVHVDDILCLSVENCSFNLPLEESPSLDSDDAYEFAPTPLLQAVMVDMTDGWAYDPQLAPPLPRSIEIDRLCVEVARGDPMALRTSTDALTGLMYGHIPGALGPTLTSLSDLPDHIGRDPMEEPLLRLVMVDSTKQAVRYRGRDVGLPTDALEVVWDRFGDRYVRMQQWEGKGDLVDEFHPYRERLTKVWPEKSKIRNKYLQSATIYSPKRLVGSIF